MSRLIARRGRHRRPRSRLLLLAVVVVGLVAGAGVVLTTSASRGSGPAAAPLPTHPFTLQPAAVAPVVAAAAVPELRTQPSHVYVPSLGIAAPWVTAAFSFQFGLTVPADVHTIGLSAQGGQPGQADGTVLLAGHVNYVGQGAGAFEPLYRVQPGAPVILTDQAGHGSVWVVVSLTAVLKAELPHSIFTPIGSRRLILATCGGALSAGNYDHNVLVTAVPADTATQAAAVSGK
jgi:hypothetical protein